MQRRQFLAASLAASTFPLARADESKPPAPREFYQLRCYRLQSGPQATLTERFLGDALVPALGRMGMGPVGAFRLDIGPETPKFYVLIPGPSAEALAMLDLQLAKDPAFLAAAAPFWNAPATSPAFERVEYSLLSAFAGWPKATPPADKGKRIFQLRTYESPTYQDHIRKVEMFHDGEFQIFTHVGFRPVFFADTLVGSRMPSLTYMLSFVDMNELNAKWDAFRVDPAWLKLRAAPRYAFEDIVTNITNLVLSPLAASQI